MSILPLIAEVAPPTVPPTTAPTTAPTAVSLTYALGMIAFALIVAAALRVLRLRSIEGPPRLSPGIPARPVFLVTLLAGGAWIFTQALYVRHRAAELAGGDPSFRFTPEHFNSNDFAFLSTVPFFVGLVIFVLGDAMFGRGMIRRIGYNLRRLPLGVLMGALAMLIVFPLMTAGGILLELAYRAVDYQHPQAHELLTAMKEVSPSARIMMIVGACAGAPLFEELLFRGHVQTILVRLFTPRSGARRAFPNGTENPAESSFAPIPQPAAEPAASVESSKPAPAAAWAAVIVTSILFAIIHPLWTAPLIFVLALCLGYAYERTGNLWVPIGIHALFNGGQTIYFLYFG